jgi:hypothetical protein
MSLWQCVLVIPTSIAICEQGFLGRRTQLNLETLDALMRASLNGLEVDAMNWNAIYNIWKVDTKTKKWRPAIFYWHHIAIWQPKFQLGPK